MWKDYEQRTGYRHNSLNPEVQKKMSDTYFKRTGYRHNFSNPTVINSRKKKYKEKTGYDNPFQNPIIKEKIKNTNLKTLGVEYPSQSPLVIKKQQETILNHYGVKNLLLSPEYRKKIFGKYFFENTIFDSGWEIAFYIWLRDNGIDFKYQPNIQFEYTFEGKSHFYFPDFLIGDEIIELKSDYLLEKMKKENTLDNAKYYCMLYNNIKIYNFKDIKFALDYVKKTYGKNYLKQFKIKKDEHEEEKQH